MLHEDFVTAVCGPPIASNTSISKDNAIYTQQLFPSYKSKEVYKKGATPINCLAVSDTHIYAAQDEKAYVHVYSRMRGNQEAFVPLPERIRCLILAGDVLIMGTVEGRLMLWETCTGRFNSTTPLHVQAITCLSATPYHLLTGSDDSNIHVWSLAKLLEIDLSSPSTNTTANSENLQPLQTLSSHRGAITALATAADSRGGGANPDTSLCVTASKDKTCILWNYHTGMVLRTLLFPDASGAPMCMALDPCARAFYAGTEDGSVFGVDFFASNGGHLLGLASDDVATVVTLDATRDLVGEVDKENGPALCMAVSYDGSMLLTGHPRGQVRMWSLGERGGRNASGREIDNLNAAVTNVVLMSPLEEAKSLKAWNVAKPTQAMRAYTFTTQLDGDLEDESGASDFASKLQTPGYSSDHLDEAILAFQQRTSLGANAVGDQDQKRQIDELWEIIDQQRLLQRETMAKFAPTKI